MIRRLAIRTQILIIIAISILSFIFLAFYYSFENNKLDKIEYKLGQSRELSAIASIAHKNLLQMVPLQKDFSTQPDEAKAETFNHLNRELELSLKKLEGLVSDKSVILQLEEHQKEIDQLFNQLKESLMVLGYSEKEGQRGKLRNAVHSIETELKDIQAKSIGTMLEVADQLTIKMLMMRRHEKDYIIRGNREKYLGRVDQRATEFREILTPSPFINTLKEKLDGKLATYVQELTAYAETKENLSQIRANFEDHISQSGVKLATFAQQADKAAQTALMEAQSARNETKFNLLIGALVAISLMTILGLSIARIIVSALNTSIANLMRLEKGDTSIEVVDTDLKNEIGEMARALLIFRDNRIETEHLRQERKIQKQQSEIEQRAALVNLANSFETDIGNVIHTVTSAVTQLQAASTQMAQTARHTTSKTREVAFAADEASQNVQTVASASEELSSSIHEISRQVATSSTVSERAVKIATETSATIEELSATVAEISNVVSLITDIAEQTNMLALNATIESARAGESGKGFAVVASEVKNLANQTSSATDEIARQITHIQAGTTRAVSAIDSISSVIQEINDISSNVATAVQQQAEATGEIARSVEQASSGTQLVHHNISDVEQATKDTGDAAEQIAASSDDLSRQSSFLQEKVASFLHSIQPEKVA
ncbi:MAG: methyl-accepting chemotaxis protein [Terasakiella sp.]|uniref:methyl-accepting chemotaxis protein n=1 Tax=unclassified Terasakiella TaxID=2614952 RepID=UPI003AFFB96D